MGGRSIVVNLGRPRILLGAIPQATYKPILPAPYDKAVDDAVALVPSLIEAESRRRHRVRRPQRQAGHEGSRLTEAARVSRRPA
ncbi:hypothetical protein ACRAWG_32600 [Methylobacterium sp. P31]